MGSWLAGIVALALAACGSPAERGPDAASDAAAVDAANDRADAAADRDADEDIVTVPRFPGCPGLSSATLPLRERGFVVDAAGLEVELTAITPEIVRIARSLDGARPARSYAVVAEPDRSPWEVGLHEGDPRKVSLCTSALIATVDLDTAAITVRDPEGRVLREDATPPRSSEGRIAHRARPGERFYGLGERTGGLDRRGRVLTFWNTDAYDRTHGGFAPGADPLYLGVPFYVALHEGRAHGVLVDDPRRIVADVASSNEEEVAFAIEGGGAIVEHVIAGPRIADVMRGYGLLTGTIPMPPRWALGYHQSRWGYAPSMRVQEIASELRSRSIPADAIWLDIQHMEGFRTFTFSAMSFPDPEGLAAGLAEQGFALVVIADPGIKQDEAYPVFTEARDADLFLREPSGDLYVGTVWPGASSFLDFTREDARAYWGRHVGDLVRRGVDGIWLDVNEPTTFPEGGGGASVPNELPVHGDGVPTTMAEVHNVYALLEARATREGLGAAGVRRPFVLTRAGSAGIQRYAAVWTGDAPSSWHSLRETLPMLLGLGLSGVPFVGSDVGGYSGHATPELYARWIALGSMSPFFRGHVTQGVPDQEPWAFGVDVETIARRHVEQRYRLLPYLYSLFDEARRTGAPILRPMIYEEQSAAFERVDDQAMLGSSLLIAPVLEESAITRRVTFPAGRWFEVQSGAMIEGGEVVVDAPLGALPLFAREGAIVPTIEVAAAAAAPWDRMVIDLFPPTATTTFVLYEDDDDARSLRSTLELARTSTGARFAVTEIEGDYAPTRARYARFRRVDHTPIAVELEIDGVRTTLARRELAAMRDDEPGYAWDEEELAVIVALPRVGRFAVELRYDASIDDPRPLVAVPIEIEVPEGTPQDRPICVASSASGWMHEPLVWVDSRHARGVVHAPRGSWLEYKLTRGDWDTVEKDASCQERPNRAGLASRIPLRDRVARFRETCE